MSENIEVKPKKKILLLSDDIRMSSGISTISRELVMGIIHRFDIVNIGGAMKHPESGKIVDMSEHVKKVTGVKDVYLKIYPVNGYGNEDILFQVMEIEKPDAILHITDPRFWQWLYLIERKIRQKIPLVYINIWDSTPYPCWNRAGYESCDSLFAISKQTYNINKWVLRPENCLTMDGDFDKEGNLIKNKG